MNENTPYEISPEEQAMIDELNVVKDSLVPFAHGRDTVVLIVVDFVCPRCSKIHQAPLNLKGVLPSGIDDTIALVRKLFFYAYQGTRPATDEDYAAAEAEAKDGHLDGLMENYISGSPKADA